MAGGWSPARRDALLDAPGTTTSLEALWDLAAELNERRTVAPA
jgi:hypothetical protein